MTPQQNLAAVEGREALVSNLFGAKKAQMQTAEMAKESGRKRKAKEAGFSGFGDDAEDDIKLI